MEKIILLIVSVPFYLGLLQEGQKIREQKNSFFNTDTIPLMTDTAIVKTCIDCHGSLVEKKIKHTTKTEKGCEDCHKSSIGKHPTDSISLQMNLPDLCLSCHKKMKDKIENSLFIHEVVKDKKSCINCHSSHSSDEKKLLITNKKELCLSCHNKSIPTKTKTLSNIAQEEKVSKSIHPPFKKCSASCHNPHASDNSVLLNTPYTTHTYIEVNPDSFALCWECHDTELIKDPQTKTATSFIDGDNNLHYIHVHGEKGRNCLICHSPHATKNQHLIREKVGYGKWEFKMNYKSDENGGSCAPGCHAEKKYAR